MRTLILGLATMVFATVFGEGYITSVQLPGGEIKNIKDAETANSLTNYATRAELESGWWSEWECEPKGMVSPGSLVYEPFSVVWKSGKWILYLGEAPADTPQESSDEDADRIDFTDGVFYPLTTATRHRVAAPVPTKPEDIGAVSIADATLTPVYSQTPSFTEWTWSPTEYQGDPVEFWITYEMEMYLAHLRVGSRNYQREVAGDVSSLDRFVFVAFVDWDGEVDIVATRTRTDVIGYTLGDQTTKPLQPKGEYAPANNIQMTALANDVQTSLTKADTSVQYIIAYGVTNAVTIGSRSGSLDTAGRNSLVVGGQGKAGDYSFSSGYGSESLGVASSTQGGYTIARNSRESAIGSFNVSHYIYSQSFGNPSNTLHSIGVGTSISDRKNAVEVMQNGNVFVLGVGGYDGTNPTGQSNEAMDLVAVMNSKAPSASPVFTGSPKAPTVENSDDNTTAIATTAFVQSALRSALVNPLASHNYDFSTNAGVYRAVKDLVEALGGSVTNFPAIP